MAEKNIKGITIQINGDTTNLQKALREPEKDARSLQTELRQINSALKFNPDSLELLAQKSTILGQEIAAVSEKLKVLRDSQAQVAAQAASGDIGEEQYRAFNREIVKTADQLNSLKVQLQDNGNELINIDKNAGNATKSSQAFQRAIDEQRKAVDTANESSSEHGKTVRKLKDDFEEAETGALSFSDAVKASTLGNLFADGIQKAASALWNFAAAGAESARELEVNQRKLELILRNTVDASDGYIQSVNDLIAAEEQLGVVSINTQTAAAQELATYVERKGSVEALLPVLNDMIAQQYGVNASQESAVTVATALGKTLDGQVGSLTRWGYRFSEAEKEILETGNEAEKLDVILGVVTDSVGGLSHGLRDSTEEGKKFGTMLEIGALQREFGQNIESIKNSVIANLLPPITEAITTLNTFLTENGEVLERLSGIVAIVIDAFTGLLKIITSIPSELLAVVAGILLGMKTFTSAAKGLKTLGDAFSTFSTGLSPVMAKILLVVAVLAVLLFLILAIKEGVEKASSSMQRFSQTTGNITNPNAPGSSGQMPFGAADAQSSPLTAMQARNAATSSLASTSTAQSTAGDLGGFSGNTTNALSQSTQANRSSSNPGGAVRDVNNRTLNVYGNVYGDDQFNQMMDEFDNGQRRDRARGDD